MNVERWLKAKRQSWQKLEVLLKKVEHQGVGRLNRTELQELGRLYRAASADLSRARALKLGVDMQGYLNNLVVKAHNQVYQTRQNRWRDFFDFLWRGFPALVRNYSLYVLASFTLFIVPFLISYVCVLDDINFAQLEVMDGHPILADEMWTSIENHKMWTDEVEHASPIAASLIWTNNVRVSVLAFVLGITFGLGTLFILFNNGLSIGTVFGVCKIYNMDGMLLAFVAPHGVLELSAIFISGGAGLLIGKALVFPGQYGRIDALKLVSKPAGGLFLGCVPMLIIAGMIEGFISPRTDLSAEIKYGVSLGTLVCLALYLFAPRKSRDKKADSSVE